MSKKRAALEKNMADPFAVQEEELATAAKPLDPLGQKNLDEAIFGLIGEVDKSRHKAMPINIFQIYPNPTQPRRTIPHKIRERLREGQSVSDIFADWVAEVEKERGKPFPLEDYLNEKFLPAEFDANADRPGYDEHGEPLAVAPMERKLMELIELAVSIRKDGLTNAITVVRVKPTRYEIETGERRWLAFQLLYHYLPDERDAFNQIAARTVEKINVWRQAAENNARADLNAISKARQLAILVMDLLYTEAEIEFTPYYEFQNDQAYYAQVADGEEFRIPRGSADMLLNATGFKNKRQLRDYRALLRLPARVWKIADDLNWSERFLRDMLAAAHGDEDLLIRNAEWQAQREGYTVPMGTVKKPKITHIPTPGVPDPDAESVIFVQQPGVIQALESEAAGQVQLRPERALGSQQYFSHFVRVLKKAGPGNREATEAALEEIHEMRRWLEEQEALLWDVLNRE
jgi:hypothetical protein